jgi:hypothetical protein
VGFLAEVVCLLNQWIHGSSILFPRDLIPPLAGLEEGEEPSGENVLRLIQIRLVTPSLKKSRLRVKAIRSNANR